MEVYSSNSRRKDNRWIKRLLHYGQMISSCMKVKNETDGEKQMSLLVRHGRMWQSRHGKIKVRLMSRNGQLLSDVCCCIYHRMFMYLTNISDV